MLKKHIFSFLTHTKLETLILMYSVISRNGSCLHVLDRTSKPNIVRPRPKEPFGLGAKAERPKLMRCISKTKKASRKAPCWLKKQTFFSLFSFDGLVFPRPKFCPKLNETLPPLYVQYVFESTVIAFKEAAKDNNHMSDEDV